LGTILGMRGSTWWVSSRNALHEKRKKDEAIHPKSTNEAICDKIKHELKPNKYPSHLHHHQQK